MNYQVPPTTYQLPVISILAPLSAIGTLKTMLARRLLGEKGDIIVNNNTNSDNINPCLYEAHYRS